MNGTIYQTKSVIKTLFALLDLFLDKAIIMKLVILRLL